MSGDWAETGRPTSMSSVITIPQPPTVPGEQLLSDTSTEIVFAPVDPDLYGDDVDYDFDGDGEGDEEQMEASAADEEERERERKKSLEILQSAPLPTSNESSDSERLNPKAADGGKPKDKKAQAKVQRRPKSGGHDAVIVLKEEKVRLSHYTTKYSILTQILRPTPSMTS